MSYKLIFATHVLSRYKFIFAIYMLNTPWLVMKPKSTPSHPFTVILLIAPLQPSSATNSQSPTLMSDLNKIPRHSFPKKVKGYLKHTGMTRLSELTAIKCNKVQCVLSNANMHTYGRRSESEVHHRHH